MRKFSHFTDVPEEARVEHGLGTHSFTNVTVILNRNILIEVTKRLNGMSLEWHFISSLILRISSLSSVFLFSHFTSNSNSELEVDVEVAEYSLCVVIVTAEIYSVFRYQRRVITCHN